MAEVEIIRAGDPAAKAMSDPQAWLDGSIPRNYVWVGSWHSQHVDGGGGLGSQGMGLLIQGHANGHQVFSECLPASATVFEPNTRNKGGGLGAYRDLPPTQEAVDAAIVEAMRAVEQAGPEYDPYA